MARIRTIKPDFFRHGDLFDAEKESKLPLRIAYIGLWTVCDREGRFKWKPRDLKVDCLPFDDVDFSRVLDALETRGFVVKYAVDGKEYGVIPSFTAHQIINNKESVSQLPEPNENNILTRDARVSHAIGAPLNPEQGEGKGKEGKGKEGAPGTRKPTKTKMPSDFCVSERVRTWATEKGHSQLEEHLESFKAKCAAKGYEYVDWDAAFMEAVRENWAKLAPTPKAGAVNQIPHAPIWKGKPA